MLILALKLETTDPATQSVCSAYFPPIYIILTRHRAIFFILFLRLLVLLLLCHPLAPTDTGHTLNCETESRRTICFAKHIILSVSLVPRILIRFIDSVYRRHRRCGWWLAAGTQIFRCRCALEKIKHTFNSTISLHIDSVTYERETRLHVPLYRTAYRSELTNEKSRRYFCFRIFAVCIQITFGAELSIFISLLSFGIQFERYASISLSLFLASSFHLLSLYINRRHRAHNLFAFRFGIFSSTIACLFEYFM